jgi:hypothetical protein
MLYHLVSSNWCFQRSQCHCHGSSSIPEDEGYTVTWNICKHLPSNTPSHPQDTIPLNITHLVNFLNLVWSLSFWCDRLWCSSACDTNDVIKACAKHHSITLPGNIHIKMCLKQLILHLHRGADNSLARPGTKQATATEDFEFHISYCNHNWRNISTIYIYNKTSINRNILTIKQNTWGSRSG